MGPRFAIVLFALAGCGGRAVTPPPGFQMQGRPLKLETVAKPDISAQGPLLNVGNEQALVSALEKLDLRPIVERAANKSLPAPFRKGKNGLPAKVELKRMDAIQPVIGADWHLRVDVEISVMDGASEIYRYEHRECVGNELNGRELDDLSVDQLSARGGQRIAKELEAHLTETVLPKIYQDLEAAMKEAVPEAKEAPKKAAKETPKKAPKR